MIDEYSRGRTPNPDIMCNQEVKFKLFLDAALEDGADVIATGHYARVKNAVSLANSAEATDVFSKQISPRQDPSPPRSLSAAKLALLRQPSPIQEQADEGSGSLDIVSSNTSVASAAGVLMRAADEAKDQTYFLYRVTGQALGKTIFPLGDLTKTQVRDMAKTRGLFTAGKKDSQGICFVGKIGIRDFLSQYVQQKPGEVIDKKTGRVLGHHDGAIFYTLGQRHGLDIGGGLPYYVVGKDMAKNAVYVTTDLNDESLWRREIALDSIHWINQTPPAGTYQVRVRHRAPLIDADLAYQNDQITLKLKNDQRGITAGQSVVIYDDIVCLGGGVVTF